MSLIHPTAIVHPNAQIDGSVKIGPYCLVGEFVSIGAGTVIESHTVIEGRTTIGRDNHIGPHAAIGGVPQDKKYAGEPTKLIIGDRNTIREFASIHIGTAQDKGVTQLGSDNWIMGMVHIAHDCVIGNHTIMANFVGLAGHVTIEDHAFLAGYCGVHQFCRVGAYAITGAQSAIVQDVPPYTMVSGNPVKPYGLNRERLKRENFSLQTIAHLKQAYRLLYRSPLSQAEALEQLASLALESAEVNHFVEFIAASQRGIVR